jgi:hypothetical protein
MAYDPPVKLYYGPPNSATSSEYRIVPAPTLNVSTNLNYANDNIVGYDYNITLSGFITVIDRTEASPNLESSVTELTEKIDAVSKILSFNGGQLTAVGNNNQNIIKAKGGILQKFSIEQSDNLWTNYAPFTAEFRFGEVEYFGCDTVAAMACSGILYENSDYNSGLIDISKYKISTFSDNWTFDLNQDTINNRYLGIHNEHINIQYEISATGKLFFNNDKVLPAWEQAKNFCQDRVYNQVKALNRNILPKSNNNNDGCSPSKTIDDIHKLDSNNTGIINLSSGPIQPPAPALIPVANYKIFNEAITCSTSESQGTFSVTYSAILKKTNTTNISTEKSIHTFTFNKNTTNFGNKNVNISVDGNIQGLVLGGLINNPSAIEFPKNGTVFLLNSSSPPTKYAAALECYNKIILNDDLTENFKTFLNLDNTSLGLSCAGRPKSSKHNAAHNYFDGTITYSTQFDAAISCLDNTPIRLISIVENDKTPRIAEFIIPGRSGGPIIQQIGSDQPKTIDVNIQGYDKALINCCFDPSDILNKICNDKIDLLPTSGIPNKNQASLILTTDEYTTNSLDGSFSIQRVYTCCDLNN